jgi:hypothetical protein
VNDGSLDVIFKIVKGPRAPDGNIKEQHMAKPKTGDYCVGCEHSLLCISGHVAVQQCTGCMRVYVEGMLLKDGPCKGFDQKTHPMVFVKSCALCAEEYVQQHMKGALDQFVGQPVTPATLEQIKANLKAQALTLLNQFGWEIDVEVVCEKT